MIRSIIKENKELRAAFIKRRKELKWTQAELAQEAGKLGRPEIRRQSINRYEKAQLIPGVLNDEQIIFLACLLDIPVQLVVGEVVGKFKTKLLKYNKTRASEAVINYEKGSKDAQANTTGNSGKTAD